MLGLVLSGGGARGAYEAGVLRYVMTELPKRTGVDPMPKIVCGTSIGALTGAWIAAMGTQGAMRISRIWQEMEPHHVYRFRAKELVRAGELLGLGAKQGTPRQALFDPAPVEALVRREIPWAALHESIDRGRLHAFVAAATDVASGVAIAWVDGARVDHACTPTTCMIPARVGPEHCLASAAIPFVFPAVDIGGRWYVDGALRQNTPLSPAVALGADRVLVVGVKRRKQGIEAGPTAYAPTPAFLAGKALNALMLDPIEEDLRRLASINEMLEWGRRAYPGFLERMAEELHPYRIVRAVHIQPSEDLGGMAAASFRDFGDQLPLATRLLLRGVARNESPEEADLVSYLLFHRSFTGEAEALGFSDAARREEELATLYAEA